MHSNNHILVYNLAPTRFGALGAQCNPDEIALHVLRHETIFLVFHSPYINVWSKLQNL
jgi:hypothetical protein